MNQETRRFEQGLGSGGSAGLSGLRSAMQPAPAPANRSLDGLRPSAHRAEPLRPAAPTPVSRTVVKEVVAEEVRRTVIPQVKAEVKAEVRAAVASSDLRRNLKDSPMATSDLSSLAPGRVSELRSALVGGGEGGHALRATIAKAKDGGLYKGLQPRIERSDMVAEVTTREVAPAAPAHALAALKPKSALSRQLGIFDKAASGGVTDSIGLSHL